MEKKIKKVKKCLTETVEHDKLEKPPREVDKESYKKDKKHLTEKVECGKIKKSPKGERSSLKTKQNVKNHERKKFRKLRKQTIMESLILAQDERWRRA